MNVPANTPDRLERRLGIFDAVVIGLGSMIGAGVFAAFGPAARASGNGILIALAVAAFVAYCNATSSAELAALYPESGGAYVYGRKRLGRLWGFVAGWSFVVGKLASCAAMAMTFASYAAPRVAHPLAACAVLILTGINYFGVQKTAMATRVIVSFVILALVVVVAAVWLGGATDRERLWPLRQVTPYGVLQAAGLLFFAFAGYARVATLGEEVMDPERTIPRAIPIALGVTLLVYFAVALSALAGADTAVLASSTTPLATVVQRGRLACLTPAVRVGASVASLGVLLSLIAGISRTTFAMAANRDLPFSLSAVHPRYRVPYRAEIAVGLIVAVVAALVDIRSAIGFSSFAVLIYYAIANASAWTLARGERKWPRALAAAGLLGCVTLAITLPAASIVGGALLVALGIFIHVLRPPGSRRDDRARPGPP